MSYEILVVFIDVTIILENVTRKPDIVNHDKLQFLLQFYMKGK